MLDEKTYNEMKRLIAEHENPVVSNESDKTEKPYITNITIEINTNRKYNKNYGDNRECECGHSYYRHFDSYERMEAVGCKYCQCYEFKEKQ